MSSLPSWTSWRNTADRWAALVVLAGRVQIARPVAERGRAAGLRTQQRRAQLGHGGVELLRRRREPEHREVVRRRLARRAPPARRRRPRSPGQLPALAVVGQHLFVLSLASWTLGWSNGLISAHPAGDRGRELGEEEDPARGRRPVHRQRDRRVAGSAAPRLCAARPASGAAAMRRWTKTRSSRRRPGIDQRLVRDRQDAGPSLPVDSAMSCSARGRSGRRRARRRTSALSRPRRASSPSARPSHRPELASRVAVVHGDLGDLRAVQQRVDVDAHQRRRHEAEVGQRRVAPADVGSFSNTRRKPRRPPSAPARTPGSVTATKCAPSGWRAGSSGTATASRSSRPTSRTPGTASGRGRRALDRQDCAGSVESSTCSRSAAVVAPNERRSTSGASDEPPMPSRTTSV